VVVGLGGGLGDLVSGLPAAEGLLWVFARKDIHGVELASAFMDEEALFEVALIVASAHHPHAFVPVARQALPLYLRSVGGVVDLLHLFVVLVGRLLLELRRNIGLGLLIRLDFLLSGSLRILLVKRD